MRPTRPVGAGLFTVVVCTDGRRPELAQAVASVLAQTDAGFELLVVDNAPRTGCTESVLAGVDDPRLRVVSEPRRGLSVARNTGVRSASGEVIAFTDDDCVVEPGWLAGLRTAFAADPQIAAVTGRTVAVRLTSPVQRLFEQFGSFDRGSVRVLWHFADAGSHTVLSPALTRFAGVAALPRIFPYAGVFGSGNNMAFTTAVLGRLGPFDEALGAGTPAAGGEDLDMFVRLMLAGEVLVYEPAAVVRHSHRHDDRSLRDQVRSYGSGLSAMITKQLLLDRAGRRRIARRVLPGLRHLFSSASPKNSRKTSGFPRGLTRAELSGMAAGPWLYLRGRRALRRRPSAMPATTAAETRPAERALVP